MGIHIILDSSADLRPNLQDLFTIIPLTVSFGEAEYVDGVTIDHQTFYQKLIESDELPKTSQATPAAFEEVFQKVTDAGDTAVVITLSSALSGTYQSAVIAAEDFPEKVFVVDSGSVAMGSGILAERALFYREQGLSAVEIAAKLDTEKEKIRIVALLDTLEYLKKGGRISAAVAFAGGLLSIKPVVCLDKGIIHILGKARGSKQGNNLLVQEIDKVGGVDFSRPVLLGYSGLSDVLLQKYITDSRHLWEGNVDRLDYTAIGSVIGTHVGPGAIAVAFFTK